MPSSRNTPLAFATSLSIHYSNILHAPSRFGYPAIVWSHTHQEIRA